MAEDEFYRNAGEQRLAEISAARSQALADLESYRATGDYSNAGDALQRVANCDAEYAALVNLHQRYIASVNPPRPPEPSAEERKHRDWSRMDWTDVVDLARQSKYARDIRPDDPGLIAGWQEAQRRRGRGE